MADFKKDAPAPARTWHPIEIIVILLVLASIVGAIVNGVANYLSSNELSFFGFSLVPIKNFFFGSLAFKFISITISIGALTGVVVLSHLKGQILIAERAKLYPYEDQISGNIMPAEDHELIGRWKKIVEHAASQNESDWRIAIIEADVILEDLLYKLNLPGNTVGEKLKAVEKSDFLTLNEAWEAHKIRNEIAHAGSGFQLNQRETLRAISMYEKVFKEFYLI